MAGATQEQSNDENKEMTFENAETNFSKSVTEFNQWLKQQEQGEDEKQWPKINVVLIVVTYTVHRGNNHGTTRCWFKINSEESNEQSNEESKEESNEESNEQNRDMAVKMNSFSYMEQNKDGTPKYEITQGTIIRLVCRSNEKIHNNDVKIFENQNDITQNVDIEINGEIKHVFLPKKSNMFLKNDLCNKFLNTYGRSNWEQVPQFSGRNKTGQYVYLDIEQMFTEKYRNLQWFYLSEYNLAFCMKTNVPTTEKKLQKYLRRRKYNDLLPEHYQNMTEPLWIACRYKWITEKILYGQDNQFNIFRSFCFLPPPAYHENYSEESNEQSNEESNKESNEESNGESNPKTKTFVTIKNKIKDERVQRLVIGLVCLILQVCLTAGIVIEVITNWDINILFDPNISELIIVIISVLVFVFILLIYYDVVKKFYEFYSNMEYVAVVSWTIYILDFISNIVVGFVIVVVSLLFLLQSETITDVVLNSFALTFIIELDDIANLFEADEDVLVQNDWYHLSDAQIYYARETTDYDSRIRARVIDIPWDIFFTSVTLTILSPLFGIIFGLYYIGRILQFMCCCGGCRNSNLTEIRKNMMNENIIEDSNDINGSNGGAGQSNDVNGQPDEVKEESNDVNGQSNGVTAETNDVNGTNVVIEKSNEKTTPKSKTKDNKKYINLETTDT